MERLIIEVAREVFGVGRTYNRKKQIARWTNEIKEETKNKKKMWKKYISIYMAYKYQKWINTKHKSNEAMA